MKAFSSATASMSGIVWILAAALASVLALSALGHHARVAEAAASIDSISPSCASVGARVTIAGHGFGGTNVRIGVGGVAAQVVAATGNSATFVVPAGVHLGPTTVTATNPGGQAGSRAFRVCDVLMPAPWAGTWQLTITYRSASTQSITAVDVITAFIRSQEAFGVAVAANHVNCTGGISDVHFDVHCSGQVVSGLCTGTGDVQVAADRTADTLTGSGASTIALTGACGPFPSQDQTVQIAGLRISLDQGGSAPPTTFIQSFVPQAVFLGLLQ